MLCILKVLLYPVEEIKKSRKSFKVCIWNWMRKIYYILKLLFVALCVCVCVCAVGFCEIYVKFSSSLFSHLHIYYDILNTLFVLLKTRLRKERKTKQRRNERDRKMPWMEREHGMKWLPVSVLKTENCKKSIKS